MYWIFDFIQDILHHTSTSHLCYSYIVPKLSDLSQVESFYFPKRWSVVSEQQHGEPGGTQITLVLSHWSSELLCCVKYEWEVGVRRRACSLRSVLRLGGFSGCKHNSVEVFILSATCVFYLPHRSLSSSFLWAICGQISSLNSIWVTVNKTRWLWFSV